MKYLLSILFGGGIGFVGGYHISKRKFVRIAENQINRIRQEKIEQSFDKQKNLKDETISHENNSPVTQELESKEEIINDQEFISEEEFGTKDDYDQKFLIMYSDKVLAYDDAQNLPVSHEITDWHLPKGWFTKLKTSDGACVWVRDNVHKEDFQIISTDWKYKESKIIDSVPQVRDRLSKYDIEDIEDEEGSL